MIAALLKQIHYRAIFNRDFQTIHLGGQVTKHSTTAIVRKMTFLLSREQAEPFSKLSVSRALSAGLSPFD